MANLLPKVMMGNFHNLTRKKKNTSLGTKRVTKKVNHKKPTRCIKNYNGPQPEEG